MKKLLAVWLLCALAGPAFAAVARPPDVAVLLRSYYRYLVTQQVGAQVQTMSAPLAKADATAVQATMTAWTGQRMEVVRQDLVAQFGEQGRLKFEQFFGTYTEAEKSKDPQYLRSLCAALGAQQPYPADYAALRQLGLNAWLQQDIQASSKFLADVQTWLQLKSRTPNMPPLTVWLARDTAAPATLGARVAPPPQKTVAQQLASAEAPMPDFKAEDEAAPGSNPLEAFSAQRKERRERAVKEAQEAMAQVATERQAAEQEYASKKQAEASAEAEAMKNHAQRLADNEKQAIEQEKDSWSAKLKGVVGATITAAGGAFFGGVGAQAGQMAANFIFQAVPGLGGAPATAPAATE
jgi:hypothetical protein